MIMDGPTFMALFLYIVNKILQKVFEATISPILEEKISFFKRAQ